MKLLAKISAFLPLAVTLIWLQFLPERVPVHYDAAGTSLLCAKKVYGEETGRQRRHPAVSRL